MKMVLLMLSLVLLAGCAVNMPDTVDNATQQDMNTAYDSDIAEQSTSDVLSEDDQIDLGDMV